MPALVKSSTALGAGGLSLLRQEVRVQSASEIVLDAEYCCLPAYAETWTQRLRIGAPTPLPAPTVISYYNLLSPLALATVSQNTTQGLTYFSCSFSAPRDSTTPVDANNPTAPQFETTVTSQVQEQSLSGSYQYTTSEWFFTPPTGELGAGQWGRRDTTQTRNWAFEYDSETRTVTASSEQLVSGDPSLFIDAAALYISPPRWKTRPLQGQWQYTNDGATRVWTFVEEGLNAYYKIDTITRTESSVSSKGQRRYSLSIQKVYETIPATLS